MFEEWKREQKIRNTLRKLSRQRVAMILNPGPVWVIENAIMRDEDIDAALKTCHIRGWVEILHDAVTSGELSSDGQFPRDRPIFDHMSMLYRLTEGGWGVLHRTHAWVIGTCMIAVASLVGTILFGLLSLSRS